MIASCLTGDPFSGQWVEEEEEETNFRVKMVFGKKLGRLGASKRQRNGPGSSSFDPSTPATLNVSPAPPQAVAASSETQPPSPEAVPPSLPDAVVHSSETQAPSPSLSQPNVLSPTSQASSVGASSSRRVRGPTVGKSTDKLLASNKGKKLYIPITEEFMAFGSELATPAANELGICIRRMCPIQGVNSWSDVDPPTKAAIIQAVRDKFEIGDEEFEATPFAQQVVDAKCYLLHKDWKSRMKRYYEQLVEESVDPYTKPFTGVSADDWKYLIDIVWSDPIKQKRYKAGKLNRSKLPYNHTGGSRSFPAAMSIAAEANGGELPDFCNFYKTTHTSKKTKDWIDPKCGNLYDEMVKVRDASIESGTPMTQEEISIEVLGKWKGYIKGFGVGPKPSSSESGSTAASRAREEEMSRLRAEVEQLRAEHEAQQRIVEEQQRQQQRSLEEQQRQRDEMQRQIQGLQSLVAQIMGGGGGDGPTNISDGQHFGGN